MAKLLRTIATACCPRLLCNKFYTFSINDKKKNTCTSNLDDSMGNTISRAIAEKFRYEIIIKKMITFSIRYRGIKYRLSIWNKTIHINYRLNFSHQHSHSIFSDIFFTSIMILLQILKKKFTSIFMISDDGIKMMTNILTTHPNKK